MVALNPPLCDFGWKAQNFNLLSTDGNHYSLEGIKGEKATLIMFICNHCPYVLAIIDRLIKDCNNLQENGVGCVAIMPNDTSAYPADSFDNMKTFATKHNFTFPYLYDETQEVARQYDAVCTPDFFGFNASLELQYRGRLDESRMSPVEGAKRDLLIAMNNIAETGQGPQDQYPSIGCSIKWK